MKHILFFALREDLLTMLDVVEGKRSLKYVRTGNFAENEFRKNGLDVFTAGCAIPNIGTADSSSSSGCQCYLVCETEATIQLRFVRGTGMRVCVDQLSNPDTVTFTPAGRWKDDVVLHGRVGTASQTPVSQALMRRFHNAIKKTFSKARAFYVGTEALTLLKNGKRLTAAEQSPREFDLVLGGE